MALVLTGHAQKGYGMNLAVLNRSGIWTVILGTLIIFGDTAAAAFEEPWQGAVKAALTYAAVSLGVAVNPRKGLVPGP